jgi:hypothetical protein
MTLLTLCHHGVSLGLVEKKFLVASSCPKQLMMMVGTQWQQLGLDL